MKLERLMLVLTGDADQSILSSAVQFCRTVDGRLYVLFVIEPNRIARLASLTHQKVKHVQDKTEESGWQLLYLAEDEAVENGVWTSLHLEEGNLMHVINRYVDSYQIDVLLMKRKDEAKKVFVSSSITVVGL